MTRTLTILAAVATLAVSAGAASAGTSSKPPTYTLNNTMVSGYSVKRSIVVTKATDVSSVKAKSKVTGGSNGIIAVLIGAVGVKDGTSNTLALAERSSGNIMISGSGVSKPRQGLLYNVHAGLGANAAGAPQSGTAGVAAAASQGIIMRDGRICDPIRHMGC